MIALAGAAPAAWAQDPDMPPAETPQPDSGQIPTVVEIAPAPYPPDALKDAIEGDVLLELDLDEMGSVIDARVVESAGHGFDESAQEALLSSSFTPGLNDQGQPVAVTIQYRYRFSLKAIPIVSLEGELRAAGTRAALPGTRVVATGPRATMRTAMTDDQGIFSFVDLPAGTWVLDAGGPGLTPARVEVEVTLNRVTQARIFLKPKRAWEADRADEEIVVKGDRATPEVTERALRSDEIRMQPGSAGDIVRAVQSLPGMARPPFNAGQLLVRGTGPDESGFYLGGSRLPLVFHFGGLATVINGDSLSEVVFLPGNYGVRYGRTLGGVIDMRTDPDVPERSSGYVAVDLFQSTVFIDQKAGEHTAVTLSGRRSYIDAVLAPLVDGAESVDVQLPRYSDLQARVLHRTANRHIWDALLLVSDDRFSVTVEDDGDEESDSSVALAFQKGWLRWQAPVGNGWTYEQTLMVGPQVTELEFLEEENAFDRAVAMSVRSEMSRPVVDAATSGWRIGIDAEFEWREFEFELEDLAGYTSYGDPEDGSARVIRPGIYLEQTQKKGRLEGTPGVRLDTMMVHDRFEDVDTTLFTADPRLALTYALSDQTSLFGTVGRYSQFPQLRELLEDSNGNPNLRPEWALSTSLGASHAFSDRLSLEATGYASWLQDVIVGREDRFEFQLGPLVTGPVDTGPYENAGSGLIGGIESMVRWENHRTTAWLGLTLSRSVRTSRDAEEPTLFAYDQPVVATAVVSHALPRNWVVGARFRYGSGNPYVPVANRVYDLENRSWVPIFAEDTLRMPAYWTLDARVDKRFVFRRWALTTYLDLMNSTNRRNQELVNWNADYSAEVPVYGLPIIPAFGLRGEW